MPYKLVIGAVPKVTGKVDWLRVSRRPNPSVLEEDPAEGLDVGLLKSFGRGSLSLEVARVRRGCRRTNPSTRSALIAGGIIRQEPWEICVLGWGSNKWRSGCRVLTRPWVHQRRPHGRGCPRSIWL